MLYFLIYFGVFSSLIKKSLGEVNQAKVIEQNFRYFIFVFGIVNKVTHMWTLVIPIMLTMQVNDMNIYIMIVCLLSWGNDKAENNVNSPERMKLVMNFKLWSVICFLDTTMVQWCLNHQTDWQTDRQTIYAGLWNHKRFVWGFKDSITSHISTRYFHLQLHLQQLLHCKVIFFTVILGF